jgi:uncharacterized protein YcbK (DUF882 family)
VPDSKYFRVIEMLVTNTELDNAPPTGSEVWDNIYETMRRMDEVREALGKPVRVTSGYRSLAVNTAIGGSKSSDHMTGHAVDFVCANQDPKAICHQIIAADIEFDQLIAEYHGSKWVHIGFGPRMRGEILTYRSGKYTKGLT